MRKGGSRGTARRPRQSWLHHLGRGEDDQKVHELLATASQVTGFIGFAVGRTSFWDSLVQWRANQISQQQAVNEFAQRYREFVDIFEEKARAA